MDTFDEDEPKWIQDAQEKLFVDPSNSSICTLDSKIKEAEEMVQELKNILRQLKIEKNNDTRTSTHKSKAHRDMREHAAIERERAEKKAHIHSMKR